LARNASDRTSQDDGSESTCCHGISNLKIIEIDFMSPSACAFRIEQRRPRLTDGSGEGSSLQVQRKGRDDVGELSEDVNPSCVTLRSEDAFSDGPTVVISGRGAISANRN
jgi:hypothetical protein